MQATLEPKYVRDAQGGEGALEKQVVAERIKWPAACVKFLTIPAPAMADA